MIAENPYVKQFPDMMAGKTILYCHGFASSGQSGTVERLRTVMPQARVIAPDLPVHPAEAMSLLRDICRQEQPDLIIGTSMGGMYAEQLRGYDRICVNPALEMGDTMRSHGMTGTQQFQNPRLDGVQEFYVDKALVKEYKDQSEYRFKDLDDEDRQRVYGLFGDEDTTVDTYGMFREHYPQAKRERAIIYIGMETMLDGYQKPVSSVQKAVRLLIEHYQVYFVVSTDDHEPTASWLEEHINVPAWHHAVYTHRRDLLYGDYLISKEKEGDTMATLLEYGSDTFKTWEDIIEYFSRLGGQ